MSEEVRTLSVKAKLPANARDVLTQALRDLKLGVTARLNFLRYPEAEQIAEALAWHLTTYPPHPRRDDSILHLVLEDAFKSMAATNKSFLAEAGNEDDDEFEPTDAQEEELFVVFCVGLFKALPSLAEVEIKAHKEVWDPIASPPLGDWLRARLPVDIRLRDELPAEVLARAPSKFRAAMFQRIVPPGVRARLAPHLDLITDS